MPSILSKRVSTKKPSKKAVRLSLGKIGIDVEVPYGNIQHLEPVPKPNSDLSMQRIDWSCRVYGLDDNWPTKDGTSRPSSSEGSTNSEPEYWRNAMKLHGEARMALWYRYIGIHKSIIRQQEQEMNKLNTNIKEIVQQDPSLRGPPQLNHETLLCPLACTGAMKAQLQQRNEGKWPVLKKMSTGCSKATTGWERIITACHILNSERPPCCNVCWECQRSGLRQSHALELADLHQKHTYHAWRLFVRDVGTVDESKRRKMRWIAPEDNYEPPKGSVPKVSKY